MCHQRVNYSSSLINPLFPASGRFGVWVQNRSPPSSPGAEEPLLLSSPPIPHLLTHCSSANAKNPFVQLHADIVVQVEGPPTLSVGNELFLIFTRPLNGGAKEHETFQRSSFRVDNVGGGPFRELFPSPCTGLMGTVGPQPPP